MMSGQLHCTLGTRGFFSRATGSFVSSAKGRRHERRSGSLLKDLTETGNRARKASGTQGSFTAEPYSLHDCPFCKGALKEKLICIFRQCNHCRLISETEELDQKHF